MAVKEKLRLHLLDALRGFLLLHMIAYHGMWNLVYLFGVRAPWYKAVPGYIWQQFICWSFILLSGFCWSMSRSHLKRGLLVFSGGAVVSLVTCLVMPQNRILFGILTCIGSCMLLMIPLEKLWRKISPPWGAAMSFAFFLLLRNCPKGTLGFERFVVCTLPDWLYQNHLTAYLGFPHAAFYSTDYFSLIPWFFLFATGYFLYRIATAAGWNERLFSKGQFPLLNLIGRHSLVVYLLHQPVLYGLGILFFEYPQ
ncbi:MAG: DUF1624 domain-containing protein [Oscillospiraceae bacterium]|nr:DUF1624 domain-containing protein [Oscillospiraceae bacterium]